MTDRPEFVPFEAANIGDLIRSEHGDVFQVLDVTRGPRYRITGWYWADDDNHPDFNEAQLIAVLAFSSDPLMAAVEAAAEGNWQIGTPVRATRSPRGNTGTVSHLSWYHDEMFVQVKTTNGTAVAFDPQDNPFGWEIDREAS